MKKIKNILIGVTGGIAAYKTVILVRLLREQGFAVRVVMTENAKAFVTPLTFQAIAGHRVYTQLIDTETDDSMAHIDLARWADLIVVAPATANFLAKCAHGFADDLLSTLCMASRSQVIFAPAMNCQMWAHPATQNNIALLKKYGAIIVGPESGELACGDVGEGRMLAPEKIIHAIDQLHHQDFILTGKKVVITAGPTHEPIDPIRFIGNRSSGKMGYALAQAASCMGATVTLISGPTQLPTPSNINFISVTTAKQMLQAVMDHIPSANIFIGAAAVANYRIEKPSAQKIKSKDERLSLSLIQNTDIIETVAALNPKPFVVGFAAETENVLTYAKEKLMRKKLDMMIANLVSAQKGMGVDTNSVTVLNHQGDVVCTFEEMPKSELALKLIGVIVDCCVKAGPISGTKLKSWHPQ